MEQHEEQSKFGAGTLAGMTRMGLHELRNAVYSESNVAQRQPDYGVYGNATPQEIVSARSSEEREAPEPPSALEEMHAQAEAHAQIRQPEREMDRD